MKSVRSIEKRSVPRGAAYLPSAKSRNTLSNAVSRLKTSQYMNHNIIDGTTRDGAESSSRRQYSAARRLPLLGSDRPGEYMYINTPEDSSARYRQADRALNAAYSLPKRAASKAMTTKVHL